MRIQWRRTNTEVEHDLQLCEDASGHRYCRVTRVDEPDDPNLVFRSKPVLQDALEKRDRELLSQVLLCSGSRFRFDFDEVWHTEGEWDALERGEPVPWSTGRTPVLGPESIEWCSVSFEDFLRFVLTGTLDGSSDVPFWYSSVSMKTSCDPVRCTQFYLRLFRSPGILADQFHVDQIDAGFWNITDSTFDASLVSLIQNGDLAREQREGLVRALENVYADLFANLNVGTSVYMLWELLADVEDSYSGATSIRNAMFETLAAILRIENSTCQDAALHGLNHLRDARTADVVEEFLSTPRTPDLEAYARLCAKFGAQ